MTEVEDMLLGIVEVLLKKVHTSFASRKRKPKRYWENLKLLEVAIANVELMRVKFKDDKR